MAIDSDSENAKTAGFKQTREAAEATETVFDKFQLASFTLSNGQKVAWPVHKLVQHGANRVIERERPFRPAAKLDETGRKSRRWTMEVVFNNSIREPGLTAFNDGVNLYPNVVNILIDIFDKVETGDLVVPTIGKVRAKALDYRRTEDIQLADSASMTLMFVEDNEDNVDAASIESPTINAQGVRMSGKTTFDAESVAISGNGLASMRTAASQLETVANAPGAASDDIRTQANTVRGSIEQVEGSFSRAGKEGRDTLNDPSSNDTVRALADLKDTAMRSTNEPRRGRPPLITIVATQNTNLQKVATAFQQSYTDLISVNPQLPNVLAITPNSLIKIFANDSVT